jgi:putative phosphoesterase
MLVAALYDVHGNVHALQAVLAEIDQDRVDRIVLGGDIAAGPFPKETIELVRVLGAVCIRGNADRRNGPWGMHRWVWDQLGDDTGVWLESLPEHAVLDGMFFCHATPRSVTEIVTPATSDERLAEMLSGIAEDLVIAGHTHMQQDRRVDRWRFVNPGSVGRPYEAAPGAYWALVGDRVELRRTEYDLAAAAEATRRTSHPRATELAEHLLRMPSRDDGLAFFSELDASVRVGRVGRPHGLDGSFVVENASEEKERFAVGATLVAASEPARVVASKRSGGRPVIRLDRPVERGAELAVRVGDLEPATEGSYYAFQLAGLEVVEEGGRSLGRVAAVTPGIANDVLELDSGLALPMVDACVREIDLERRVIVVARGFTDGG